MCLFHFSGFQHFGSWPIPPTLKLSYLPSETAWLLSHCTTWLLGRSVINISNHMETLLLNVLEAIYIFSFPLIMETWHKHTEKSSFSYFYLYSFGIFIHIFIQYFQLTFLNLDVIFNICGVFSSSLSHRNFSFIPPSMPSQVFMNWLLDLSSRLLQG